jgi:glycosyltransferase involved in cell wall biosynthesis
MTTRSPLISICVPNLNKRAFLAERMETLLAQTFTDWELIVCDSYSDDGSWEFLQKFKSEPRIQLYQVPRAGLYAGWNECLRRARGEFVNIATSDDTADVRLLEKLIAPFQKRPDLSLAVCDFVEIDEKSTKRPYTMPEYREFLGKWLEQPSVRDGKAEFLLHIAFGTVWVTMAAVLFRRNMLEKVGYFREDLGSFADLPWSLKASLVSDIAFVPGQLATFRISTGQASPKGWTWKQHALSCRCLESVLDDPKSAIPAEWKNKAGWKAELMGPQRADYFKSFDLYRWLIRANPKRFIRGTVSAFQVEPGYFFNQAIRGFPVGKQRSGAEKANDLLREFNGKWPPEEVSQW